MLRRRCRFVERVQNSWLGQRRQSLPENVIVMTRSAPSAFRIQLLLM